MTKKQTLDHPHFLKLFKKEGILSIQEGNGKVITLMSPDEWSSEMGHDWIYLLFDIFQIRSICEQFSEVSLDIVEFASKPTIYHSKPNRVVPEGPRVNGDLKFSLIREPNWNKLLFQISKPTLVRIETEAKPEVKTEVLFPLFSPSTKEMYLGAEGDVKILKG